MRENLPVTDHERRIEEGMQIVSCTDLSGNITSASADFVEISGFSHRELIGSSHNVVRHPDVPKAVFKEMWEHLSTGRPWSGVIKNRCRNGDYFWTEAHVTPIREAGQVVGYMSVRRHPSSDQINSALQHYQVLRKQKGKKGLKGWLRNKWLGMPVGVRIGLGFMGLFSLALLALTGFALGSLDQQAQEAENRELQGLYTDVLARVHAEERLAQALAAYTAQLPQAQEALANQDRQGLLAWLRPAFDVLKKDFGVAQFQFHTPPATSFLRLHQPEKFGDDLSAIRRTIVIANTTRTPQKGLEIGVAGAGIRGVMPLFQGAQHLGAVELGMSFGQPFLDRWKAERGVDLGVYLAEGTQFKVLATTLASPLELTKREMEEALAGHSQQRRAWLSEKPLAVYLGPVRDYSGQAIGVLMLARDRTAQATAYAVTRNTLLGVGLTTLGLVLLLAWPIARSITRPLRQATEVFDLIAEGHYHNTVDTQRRDEVGRVMQGLKAMQIKLDYDLNNSRHQAEEGLRIRTALDNVSTGVLITNRENNLIYWNPAARRLVEQAVASGSLPGFDSDKPMGTSLRIFFGQTPPSEQRLAALTESWHTSLVLGDLEFDLTINPVLDSQQRRQGTVVELNDVTASRRVQRQVEQLVATAQRGDLSGRLDLSDKQSLFRGLGEGINCLLDTVEGVAKDTGAALARVASGDLTTAINNDYGGVFAEMRDSANGTMATLVALISQIQKASATVTTAAGEIAAGNADLSRRTEQQAASLEQTAATMEELSSAVQQTASNATRADQSAQGARSVAARGQTIMVSVVDTMAAITESSHRITDITAVIDSIAFQTNILALNAAVEAARAGEQGRGFSVVAAEVRNLAGRAATAAKEIKALIAAAAERVRTGETQVAEAGRTMDEIVQEVGKVTQLMASIATATREQGEGIHQIGLVMERMDDSTQRNAALVEEATAAAESLKEQAYQLLNAVSAFLLPKDGNQANNGNSEFSKARTAHIAWRGKLRAFLDGQTKLQIREVISPRDCQFGRWLYGGGLAQFHHLPEMQELEKLHSEMHATMGKVVRLQEKGEKEDAERDYTAVLRLSTRLVDLLGRLEDN